MIENNFENKNCKIRKNILEFIGNTPIVKLNKIAQKYGIECKLCFITY